jgi:hypothetical protein
MFRTLVGYRRFSGAPMSQGPGVYSQRSSPIALIQKGDWRGSESIRDLSMRTAGALAVPMSHFPTDTSVHGCERRGRAIDRGQLNGDPGLVESSGHAWGVLRRFGRPLWSITPHACSILT